MLQNVPEIILLFSNYSVYWIPVQKSLHTYPNVTHVTSWTRVQMGIGARYIKWWPNFIEEGGSSVLLEEVEEAAAQVLENEFVVSQVLFVAEAGVQSLMKQLMLYCKAIDVIL